MRRILPSWFGPLAAVVLVVALVIPRPSRAELAASLTQLAQAGPQPAGQAELAAAWQEVSEAPIDQLPQVLAAMHDATPVGENWLRTAADAIAERQLADAGTLPAALLEEVVSDQSQPPRGRRVAYEWLLRVDDQADDRLLPTMLNDPSLDLRYDAVAALVASAEAANDETTKKSLYSEALAASRNVVQIQQIADALGELGESVDLAELMGFVRQWRLIGPFDNTDLAGFAAEYPPERSLKLDGPVAGKAGPVAWQEFTTTDKLGVVNLNEAIGNEKLVVAYALATLRPSEDRRVEFRLGSKNAVKIWINGRELAAYEVYHSGEDVDQYVVSADLAADRPNTVLVKVCQNAKSQPWEQDWQFQMRVTDHLGGAVDVAVE
ncbi:MAG: hypothetical protein KDA44_17185 [Planctomycetales bacterium]|nr:hypothetical protein [Planctomycetales bacterium]